MNRVHQEEHDRLVETRDKLYKERELNAERELLIREREEKRQDDYRSASQGPDTQQQHDRASHSRSHSTQRSRDYFRYRTRSPIEYTPSNRHLEPLPSSSDYNSAWADSRDRTNQQRERHSSHSHSARAGRYDDPLQKDYHGEPPQLRPWSQSQSNSPTRAARLLATDLSTAQSKQSSHIISPKGAAYGAIVRAYWLMLELGLDGKEKSKAYDAMEHIRKFEEAYTAHEAHISKRYHQSFSLLGDLTLNTISRARKSGYIEEKNSLSALITLDSLIWSESGVAKQVLSLSNPTSADSCHICRSDYDKALDQASHVGYKKKAEETHGAKDRSKQQAPRSVSPPRPNMTSVNGWGRFGG